MLISDESKDLLKGAVDIHHMGRNLLSTLILLILV